MILKFKNSLAKWLYPNSEDVCEECKSIGVINGYRYLICRNNYHLRHCSSPIFPILFKMPIDGNKRVGWISCVRKEIESWSTEFGIDEHNDALDYLAALEMYEKTA